MTKLYPFQRKSLFFFGFFLIFLVAAGGTQASVICESVKQGRPDYEKRGKTCQTEQPHRPQSDLIGAAFDRTLSPLHAPAYLRAAYRRRLYRMQDSNRLSWAIAILALMRNRPARRSPCPRPRWWSGCAPRRRTAR